MAFVKEEDQGKNRDRNFFEDKREWYIIQTYRGFEDAVKREIEKRIVPYHMEDKIFTILIPTVTEKFKNKKGEEEERVRKLHPGYVFIEMMVTDETWYMVRNTPHVTGFIGSSGKGAKPVPVEPSEMIPILKQCGIRYQSQLKFQVGDMVNVIAGTYMGQQVKVLSIDEPNNHLKAEATLFGMPMPIDLDIMEVEEIK